MLSLTEIIFHGVGVTFESVTLIIVYSLTMITTTSEWVPGIRRKPRASSHRTTVKFGFVLWLCVCAVSLSQNVRTGNEIQGSTVNLGFEPFQSGTPISAAPQPSG